MSVRVVAGSARGRRLLVPDGRITRPTGDRVRESVFNSLASLEALDGARVLDLFAGSGALAIEALSRGSASATLVEIDRLARVAIEANLAATGLADAATIVPGDAFAYLNRTTERYDLVLLDPPYGFVEWGRLQAAVLPRLAEDALVVMESGHTVDLVEPLTVVREKRYGSTVVVFAQLSPGTVPHAGVHE